MLSSSGSGELVIAFYFALEDEDELLNNIPHKNDIFIAIQNPISFMPNNSGITPFHSHIIGKVNKRDNPKTANTIAPNFTRISMIKVF
jgi:hypothetical protein